MQVRIYCEQALIFLCKVTARETLARERRALRNEGVKITTSWFAIALDDIRTRRILREKADCKQSKVRIAGWNLKKS